MTAFQLSDQEREGLEQLLAAGPHAREHCRLQALLWLAAGAPADDVADLLGVGRRTVYYGAQRFRDHPGPDLQARLADAPRAGRPRTVCGVIHPLFAAVLDTDPRDRGYRHTGWTNALWRDYLA